MSEDTRNAYLTIRFEGPGVKPGRMRLDDFIQAAREFSVCAQRVALALQHTPSASPGRRPTDLHVALSLDLIAFTEGSPAAVAHLERSDGQMALENADFGEQTYRALLNGIEAVAQDTAAAPLGFDLGVLMKLRDFGRVFNRGVSRVEFTLNHRPRVVKAVYDPPKQEKVRQRIAKPEAQQQTLQGRLLMADFKETGRQLRIHPPVGSPITCKFSEDLSAEVEECIRQFVRVTGKMEYHSTGEPRWLEIADIEPIEEPAGAVSAHETGWSYSFWENLPAAEYARRQGVQPVTNIASLYGAGEPEDWQGFDEAVESWRGEKEET
ncbi:MAG: hypothetical protein EXS35_04810 [Pedosphaera sp.]|nr:hypothetical protein [Pedosphaera sp.]